MGDLSLNFSSHEFRCRCGRIDCDAPPMDQRFITMLQDCRSIVGVKFKINSGSRCLYHNFQVDGAKNSQHLFGKAADIQVTHGLIKYKIVETAIALGFGGIGIARGFVHLDNRSPELNESLWCY